MASTKVSLPRDAAHVGALLDSPEIASLRDARPDMGQTVAIDGSNLPAYGNGQRFVKRGGPERKKFADPDASWGHRSSISTRSGGGYYGYKIHAAVCTVTGLPLAWQVETARNAEQPLVPTLLDAVTVRGFTVDVCVLDRGYDTEIVYQHAESRGIRPVIPLRKTPAVKAGKDKPPSCDPRRVDLRGLGRQARRIQVAVPVRGVQARVRVGQGVPAAHPDPPEHRPVQGPVPPARRGRARVRQAQARVGHAPAARPQAAASPAAR